MNEDLTCPHPDCDEVVLIDWHLAYGLTPDVLPASPQDYGIPIAPADAHAQTWTVGCLGGHILLTPGPVGCCDDDDNCDHDQESYDWQEEDRRFRPHDWHRLAVVLTALGAAGDVTGDRVCQVTDSDASGRLTCDVRDSGGFRCERAGSHTDHEVGRHTIMHSLMGNGYSCQAVDESGLIDEKPTS